MKRITAFLCIFMLGINSFLCKYTAEAEENPAEKEISEETQEDMPEAAAEGPSGISGNDAESAPDEPEGQSGMEAADGPQAEGGTVASDGSQLKGSMKVLGDTESGSEDITVSGDTPYKGIPSEADSGLVSLLIPEKLDVVLNPWEMDGQKQVYSKDYLVRNCGETAGTITLSGISCRAPGEGVDVRTDSAGIHDGAGKSIYIEMEFNEEDKLVLSQEGAEYKKYLEPGGEISFRFSGAMNENAEEEWESGDIEITILYEWEEDTEAVSEEEADNAGEGGSVPADAEAETGGGTAAGGTETENGDVSGGTGTGRALKADGAEAGDSTAADGTEAGGGADTDIPADTGGTEAETDAGNGTGEAS